MGDLHSRAATLLAGPWPLSRQGSASAVSLIQRYVDGEPWDDPELQRQLSLCLEYAQTKAAGLVGAPGPARDAQFFYQRAAAILQDIQAEVSGGPG
jgi:hypothetical protein